MASAVGVRVRLAGRAAESLPRCPLGFGGASWPLLAQLAQRYGATCYMSVSGRAFVFELTRILPPCEPAPGRGLRQAAFFLRLRPGAVLGKQVASTGPRTSPCVGPSLRARPQPGAGRPASGKTEQPGSCPWKWGPGRVRAHEAGSARFRRDLRRHPPAEHSSGFRAFAAVWAVCIATALSASLMAGSRSGQTSPPSF